MADEMSDRFAAIGYEGFIELMFEESKPLGDELRDITRADFQNPGILKGPLEKLEAHPFTQTEHYDYPILCALIDAAFHLAEPATGNQRLVVHDTSDRPDDTSKPQKGAKSSVESSFMDSGLKPDIGIYRPVVCPGGVMEQPYVISETQRTNAHPAVVDRKQWLGRSIWRWMRLFVEVKRIEPPFASKAAIPNVEAPANADTTGQIAEYAAQIRLKQHRQFQYSVVTHKQTAWLMRWDQAGALVATSFNYKDNPYQLIRFFYIIGQMNDAQLGLDPTVKRSEEEDKASWDNALKKVEDADLRKRIMASTDDDWPLQRVEVNGETLENAKTRWESHKNKPHPLTVASRQLLIGKPCVGHQSPTGRGTKGYIAFDLEGKQFVFLKDCWRLDHEKVIPEMVTYRELEEEQVENLPHVKYGGDVYNPSGGLQRTVTHRYLPGGYCPHIHTRLVLEEIGRPLNEYADSHELIQAVEGALEAHRQAWEKAGILHRDISDGNIIILILRDLSVKGLLIDWDLAKKKEDLNMGATNPGRSGTWMFLSGLIIYYPGKPYELSDDLESFVHVLVIQLLRYHEHDDSDDPSSTSLYQHVMDKYINTSSASGYRTGQPTKMSDMKYGTVTSIPLHGEQISPAFLALLTALVRFCQQHYQLLDEMKMRKNFKKTPFTKVSTEELYQGREQDSPLKNHDAMLAAFEFACRSPGWFSDKIRDQFEGLLLKKKFLETPQNKRSASEFEESTGSQKRLKGPSASSVSASLHPVPE